MKRSAAAMLCLALLGACGSGEESTDETVSETPRETVAETDPPDEDPAGETESDEPSDAETSADADDLTDDPSETIAEDPADDETAGGSFTGVAESGPSVTVTAPEGWDLYGAEDAISRFDVVTAERIGVSGLAQSVVVTDQDLGVGAEEVFETTLRVYRESPDRYSDVTVLDPIVIDGVEFYGIESVAVLSSGELRIQYWFGEVDSAVLGIYVQHSNGAEDIPDDVLNIRDTITFE